MDKPDKRDEEISALRERLARLSEASLRINESLEFEAVLHGVLDSARDLTSARYGAIILLDDAGLAEGQEGAAEAGGQADASEDAPADGLKVVVSIKGGRATIGVQQPSSDPHIESFDDLDESGLTQEVPAVIERARARWDESPKHPAYERPAPPPRRRNRRGQETAQAANAETETQQQTLRLF